MTKNPDKHHTLFVELNNVLSEKTQTALDDRVKLRDAVCAYVAAEQARGTTLATVIRTVKEILRQAEETATTVAVETERRAKELAHQLTAWCVEFHRTSPAGVM
jgi:hypothetical protein